MASRDLRTWRNWTGNQQATPARVVHPSNTFEVAEAVRAAVADGLTVKPAGSGHSFTDVAVTQGVQLQLDRLTGIVSVDSRQQLVTVRGGTTLHELNAVLAALGLAMPNLGDIDAQTVSGALATGTHGTGTRYGCLATFVESLELVTSSGDVLTCSATQSSDVFSAALVGLGALGVITELTLRCEPAFVLRADERPMDLAETLAGFDEYADANEHFEFYWMPYTEQTLVKRNNRVPENVRPMSRLRAWWEREFLQNVAFGTACRIGRSAPSLVPQLSRTIASLFSPVTFTNRSDRIFTTPRRVRFVEMEYGLSRETFPAAFDALRRIVADLPFPVMMPVEVRVTAADDIWLSHGYGRDSVYIAIHQYAGMPYEPYFRAFELACTELGGRPHWGKLHWRDAESLRRGYPRFDDFGAVRDKLDPGRVFANAYTDRVLGR